MDSITTGSSVTCGICNKETKVRFVSEREGVSAYDLECFHRNAHCDTCGKLVRDASESIHEVVAACRDCSPEMYTDDE